MNALAVPLMDFRPAYGQIDAMEKRFVDGYVADIEGIADKTGQRLLAVLQAPFPYQLDQRGLALLARPLVRAAIAERIHTLSDLYDISQYKTLKELTSIGYSNIAHYFTIDQYGKPDMDLSKCTPEQMSAVKSFEIEDKPRGGRKYKLILHDKMAALTNIMRYQGLLADDNEHWRKVETTEKPENNSTLPVGIDDDKAAEMYARQLQSN